MSKTTTRNDAPLPHHEALYHATRLAYFLHRGGREAHWFRERGFTPRRQRSIRAALAELRANAAACAPRRRRGRGGAR